MRRCVPPADSSLAFPASVVAAPMCGSCHTRFHRDEPGEESWWGGHMRPTGRAVVANRVSGETRGKRGVGQPEADPEERRGHG